LCEEFVWAWGVMTSSKQRLFCFNQPSKFPFKGYLTSFCVYAVFFFFRFSFLHTLFAFHSRQSNIFMVFFFSILPPPGTHPLLVIQELWG